MRLSLKTKNVDAAIRNIYAADARAVAGIKRATSRAGEAVHGLTRSNMLSMGIFDTGHMYDSVRLRFSEQQIRFDVGWHDEDFPRSFYPIFVVFGTTKMAGRDPLFPAHEAVRPFYQQSIADEVRASLARRSAA